MGDEEGKNEAEKLKFKRLTEVSKNEAKLDNPII